METHDVDQVATLVGLVNQNKKSKIRSTIHVTVSSLLPFDQRAETILPTQRSLRPDVKEVGRSEIILTDNLQNLPDELSGNELSENLVVDWKRLPGSPSLFPNVIFDRVGKNLSYFLENCIFLISQNFLKRAVKFRIFLECSIPSF